MELPIGSRRFAPFSLIQLDKLYQSKTFTDFTITVIPDQALDSPRAIQLRVHKVILAAASEYFGRLFQSSTREAVENRLTLMETDPEIFRKLIEATYGRSFTLTDFQEQIVALKMIKFYRFYAPYDRVHRCIAGMEVPPDGFYDYISMIEYFYDEIPPHLIELIAKKIGPEGILDELSDEMLHLLFSSKYFPRNDFQEEIQVFHLIHGLVLSGHNPELYRYVKFSNIKGDLPITQEIIDRYSEQSARFPLTSNLKEHLLATFESDSPLTSITVLVSQPLRLISSSSIGAFVIGDDDPTPIQVIFKRSGPISEGDIVEITKYNLLTDKKITPPFYIHAINWTRL